MSDKTPTWIESAINDYEERLGRTRQDIANKRALRAAISAHAPEAEAMAQALEFVLSVVKIDFEHVSKLDNPCYGIAKSKLAAYRSRFPKQVTK